LTLGAEVTFTARITVSPEAIAAEVFTVTGIVTDSPTRAVGTVPTTTEEIVLPVPAAAEAGETVDSIPMPKAETATSARRLIVVFVDIDFLSLVDLETIPRSAW
jgi:hypothetical protein